MNYLYDYTCDNILIVYMNYSLTYFNVKNIPRLPVKFVSIFKDKEKQYSLKLKDE